VEPGSSDALAEALIDLALHPELRRALGAKAYAHSRGMHWPEVGDAYRTIFDRVARRVPSVGPVLERVPTLAAAGA
jgi:glycosyltransferase involved in cell wall biosynthesis